MRWVHTSDIHGAEMPHSLKRELGADVLSDGGDCLQGNAWTCFANEFAAEGDCHLIASEMNAMGYDFGVVGNHDIEAGQNVFRKWVYGCCFPILAANITMNGVQPYVVTERDGVRFAVIGFVTTAIKQWVAEKYWEHLVIEDIAVTARRCIERIKATEDVDMIVGIFHSGWEGGIQGENIVKMVAEEVDGFDLIFYGHDHHAAIHHVVNNKGREVLCVAPSSCGMVAAVVDINMESDGIVLDPKLVNVPAVDEHARERLYPNYKDWLECPICELAERIDERDSFFGPSLFVDLFHRMQLEATGADVSFSSPVNYDCRVEAGVLRMRDIFTLYRFNTEMYTMQLTGEEIRNILEMSYSLWCGEMHTSDDDALLMDYIFDGGTRKGLKNMSLNMISAGGITYEVDLTKGVGHKVDIMGMTNGKEFGDDVTYLVAVNSYHGSGGGNLFTEGAGIKQEDLASRIVEVHGKGTRECLVDFLQRQKKYAPGPGVNWKFVPEAIAHEALKRDRVTLFGRE